METSIEPKEIPSHKLETLCRGEKTIVQSGNTTVKSPDLELSPDLDQDSEPGRSTHAIFKTIKDAKSGISLHVPESTEAGTFRHILVSDGNLVDRSVVVCEKNSSATLIVDQISMTRNPARREGRLEAHLKEGSCLTIIEIRRFNNEVEQKCENSADIGKGAKLTHIVATIGGGLSEAKNNFRITGRRGELIQRHVTLASGKECHKTETLVTHEAPCGRSDISGRSAADGNSSVTSHSTIRIEPIGQKTRSSVTDHAMMISANARCESIPSMEILANDVQARHSASTSRLDEDEQFYLQSRGLDQAEAKKQIVIGFLRGAFDDGLMPSAGGSICLSELIEHRFDSLHRDPVAEGLNRDDFPILSQKANGRPLAYLDNAATTQKPRAVIEAMDAFYFKDNANINRGMHTLGERATNQFETARKKAARFINAKPGEIVFVRNATEALNLLAHTLARNKLRPSDRVLLTEMEHHSNIVPWQMACAETKAMIDVVEVTPDGTLEAESLRRGLAQSPKIFSFAHVSNVLGTVNPAKELTRRGHESGAIVIVDGAQSAPHISVDVKDIDCDAFVFSGHKMLGPTGIGVLYVKQGLLNELPPFLGGGGIIKEVSFDKASFKRGPERFEAGTPDIAGAVGLGAAIDYLEAIGMENVKAHNDALIAYAWEKLSEIPQVKLYGPKDMAHRAGAISFNLGDIHAHDVSSILDEEGVAIRAGHHCAMPLMEKMNVTSTCRASFHIYNSKRDVDQLITAIKKAIKVFRL